MSQQGLRQTNGYLENAFRSWNQKLGDDSVATFRQLSKYSRLTQQSFSQIYASVRLELGQICDVPLAAERLDQQYAGVHTPPQDIHLVALVRERHGLSGNDLEVRVDSTSVTIREELEGFPRRDHRALLLLCFPLKNTQRGVGAAQLAVPALVSTTHERGDRPGLPHDSTGYA
jgi:hypothetical protein